MSHYQAFVDAVDNSIFAYEEIGPYLKDIRTRAKYLRSPIKSDGTLKAFGVSEIEFGRLITAFMEGAVAGKKVIPLDELVCVEDESSVVFIENDEEQTIRVTTFQNTKPESVDGVLCSGLLALAEHDQQYNHFLPLTSYAAAIYDDDIEVVEDSSLELAEKDLVDSAKTVIEQLAYMERQGLLGGIKKF